MRIEELNKTFCIEQHLQFIEGTRGFPFVQIAHKGAKALISVYGGQVLSFVPSKEETDFFFLSTKAYYENGKSIRGGIPICWPWFGPDPTIQGRPSHGFVRHRLWEVRGTGASSTEVMIKLGIRDCAATREFWPYSFDLELVVTVGITLSLALTTRNLDNKAFVITQALHSYFATEDSSKAKVLGLDSCSYLDKDRVTTGLQVGAVEFSEEVDRIYSEVTSNLTLQDEILKRHIYLAASGSATAIVWNPGRTVAEKMPDLELEDYKKFVCVETGNAGKEQVEILSGRECTLGVMYSSYKSKSESEHPG
jgi:glucose-6-phosphate 1-epimerase